MIAVPGLRLPSHAVVGLAAFPAVRQPDRVASVELAVDQAEQGAVLVAAVEDLAAHEAVSGSGRSQSRQMIWTRSSRRS